MTPTHPSAVDALNYKDMEPADMIGAVGIDAAKWAKAFCQINPACDEGTMLSWFANALMAMHDHCHGIKILNGDHAQYLQDKELQRPQPDHGSLFEGRAEALEKIQCLYERLDHDINAFSGPVHLTMDDCIVIQAALAQPGDGGEFVEKLKDKNLDDDLISIFGTLCFQAIPYAQMLRAEGHEIKNKSVDEQAAVIAWKLRFYLEHGEAWRVKISEYIERHIALSRKSEA